jgi:hypothetical protein
MVKNFHCAVIFTVGELAYDKLFLICLRIFCTVRGFEVTVRKILPCMALVNITDKCRAMNERHSEFFF